MHTNSPSPRECIVDRGQLALHVVKAMTIAHKTQQPCTLDGLAAGLRVRRTDVRAVLSALHAEGIVDVLRMRLTLSGFAVGHALEREALPRLRMKPLRKAFRRAA